MRVPKAAFLTFVFCLLSCDEKKDTKEIDSSTVVDYKVIETAKSDNEFAVEELDRKAVIDLYKHGIKKDSKHKVDFFFICPTEENAKRVSAYLENMQYTVGYRKAVEKKEFLVLGYTEPFSINENTIVDWAKTMSKVAEKNNSTFDGWQVGVK